VSRGVATLLRTNKEKTTIENEQKNRKGEQQLLVILTK
jgi:hypothetical protein